LFRPVSGSGGKLCGFHLLVRRLAQRLAQRPLDDRRHLAPKIELIPSGVDRRHALAGMREQRADLFKRVARPVQNRCGGAPKVVRRPSFHREPGDDLLRRFVQMILVDGEDRRGSRPPACRSSRRRLADTQLGDVHWLKRSGTFAFNSSSSSN
jgi:hypothetical protein